MSAPVRGIRDRLNALPSRGCWRPLDGAELPLLRWVERERAGGAIDRATAALTRAGEHGAVWYAVAAIGARVDAPRRERWRGVAVTVGVAYLAGSVVKIAARRARPPLAAIGTETALSFPSLHAATSFAAARTIAAAAPGGFSAAAAWGGALAVTASRLHFAVHYPSDLLAGAVLGDAIGRATVSRWRAEDSRTARLPETAR